MDDLDSQAIAVAVSGELVEFFNWLEVEREAEVTEAEGVCLVPAGRGDGDDGRLLDRGEAVLSAKQWVYV